MIKRRDHHCMTDQCTVIDRDPALVLELASGIDKYIFADRNVFSKIRIKWRKKAESFPDRFSDQFGKQL